MEITVVQGDITAQDVDAVVNAANRAMRGGGGVDGAIHRAGGPAMLEDCVARFPRRPGHRRRRLDDRRRPGRPLGDPRRRPELHRRRARPLAAAVLLLPRARGRRRARCRAPSRSRWSPPASTAGPRTTRSRARSRCSARRPRRSTRRGWSPSTQRRTSRFVLQWSDDAHGRRRLPGGGCRCVGDGLHGRADRPRRRAGGDGRPAARRRRALARRLPVRPPAPGLRVLRRRARPCSVAAACRTDGPETGLHERATVPEICAYYGHVLTDRMLRVGEGRAVHRLRVRRRPAVRLAGLRAAVRGAGALPGRRRALPRPGHPGRHAAAVRGRRRCAGDPGQRPRPDRRGAQPVRRRRVGQDRDRRLRLAARARRRPRRDLLGPAARPVDAQPCGGPAGPGGVPRHGRRHDAGGDASDLPRRTCSSGSRTPASCCASTGR